MRWGSLALLVLAGSGCGSAPEHELVVDIRTDARPGIDFDAVELRVQRDGEATARLVECDLDESGCALTGVPAEQLVAGTRLAEVGGLQEGPYRIEVVMQLDAAGRTYTARPVLVQVRGRTVVTVAMVRECLYVRCPGRGDDPAATACVGGRCVDPACLPESPSTCPTAQCEGEGAGTCPGALCGETLCLDGDCYTRPDDADCAPGESCDPWRGCVRTCAPGESGTSCGPYGLVCTLGSCGCPGGEWETACSDGSDDDCDGLVDCADPSCEGQACAGGRGACEGGSCSCGSAREVVCDDDIDDDCDGTVDCGDSDCDSLGCGPSGAFCQGSLCSCPAGCCRRGDTETFCSDGLDDDCDALIDCADPECDDQACDAKRPGMVCDASTGGCGCPGSGIELICDNGEDDDCDTLADCGDSDCEGTCACRDPATLPAENCNNGIDDDCNGLVDCADRADCDHLSCAGAGVSGNRRCCRGSCIAVTTRSDCGACGVSCDGDCRVLPDGHRTCGCESNRCNGANWHCSRDASGIDYCVCENVLACGLEGRVTCGTGLGNPHCHPVR